MFLRTGLNILWKYRDQWPISRSRHSGGNYRQTGFRRGLDHGDPACSQILCPSADKRIEDTGTLETVVYLADSESTLHPQQFETDHVAGEVVQFPSTQRSATLSKSVATAAQGLAESSHAAANVDAFDGVLFIDGAVYPLGVLYWVLLDKVGRTTPVGTWKLTLRELKPEFVGWLLEAVSFLDAHSDEYAFQVGGARNFGAGIADVWVINPLYSEQEVRRVFNRAQATTSAMEEKDDVWASECRPEFVRALQARVAARAGDVSVSGGGSA